MHYQPHYLVLVLGLDDPEALPEGAPQLTPEASVQQLVSWFGWKSGDMAIHYTKDLAHDMGITKLPF